MCVCFMCVISFPKWSQRDFTNLLSWVIRTEELEQIFASESGSEVNGGEEEGGSTVKLAATGGWVLCTLSSVCLRFVYSCTQL